ncbi:SDR family oxidoreductase [Flavihumibacter sp. RY-1]|uniref:SDR family oxidoreductase n=1 Tax=Flavihumibacter fluminis TaxID=2909236 RepID=A0ABS9BL21_9BACT|nr:SDR family oxidoreductase [Flavihumibacter fluminis]MCF1716398.1 SDR family oxidoreductase [Flavihumibacter fluminis]
MKLLVTGGAGFIGSHIVEGLLKRRDVTGVRVLDNLSTGYLKNIEAFKEDDRFEFIEGDIRSVADCTKAATGMDMISHQAALGSVPRSIKDPATTHDVNVNGFLNILDAARGGGIKKMTYASSSSVYGDLPDSPKVETKTGRVLSPYAAGKMANELYAEAYARQYGIQLVGFRYFNVFGPRQDPNGAYAAVIPLFVKAALEGKAPVINGDGSITRDFTYVENVVNANLNALFEFEQPGTHEVFNIACGQTTSLNELWRLICKLCEIEIQPIYGPVRNGDILQSLAEISKAKMKLKYTILKTLEQGIEQTINWSHAIQVKS